MSSISPVKFPHGHRGGKMCREIPQQRADCCGEQIFPRRQPHFKILCSTGWQKQDHAIDYKGRHACRRVFRRFLPFSPWLAPASLRLKAQKSLKNPSLTGTLRFCRSRNVSRQGKTRREAAVLSRDLMQYRRISARHNCVCPRQSMALSSLRGADHKARKSQPHTPQNLESNPCPEPEKRWISDFTSDIHRFLRVFSRRRVYDPAASANGAGHRHAAEPAEIR